MALRLYIVPISGTGTRVDPRVPKYFLDGTISASTPWTMADYGFEPWAFVAGDLSPTDQAAVVAMVDAFIIPAVLDIALTAPQVTNVQNKLEAINLPAGWVNTTLSWRDVMRTVLWISAFMQRFTALNGTALFVGGTTLSTTVGGLTPQVRANLLQAVRDLGLSSAGVTNGTTLRVGLKAVAAQSSAKPYQLGALSI